MHPKSPHSSSSKRMNDPKAGELNRALHLLNAESTVRCLPMDDEGIKERLARQGEEALGRLAEELATNPLVASALQRAFDAREKAVQAQEVAMGALNIPSAADVERLTRRLRSVGQRLEAIEDTLDRLEQRLDGAAAPGDDERLAEIARDIAALREALVPSDQPVPRAQERLSVSE